MRPLVVIVYVNRKLARGGLYLIQNYSTECVCILALLLTTLSVLYVFSAYLMWYNLQLSGGGFSLDVCIECPLTPHYLAILLYSEMCFRREKFRSTSSLCQL